MIYALVDFGSTFTKLALVDGGTGGLHGSTQHPTTIDTDVFEGYQAALFAAMELAGIAAVDRVLAASSAAGGLRMVAVGLVDDLTASAARRAALSAGAKVEGVWSGTLDREGVRQIDAVTPATSSSLRAAPTAVTAIACCTTRARLPRQAPGRPWWWPATAT